MANSPVYDNSYDSALALIGMSGRFPGAQDTTTFWRNIAAGVRSIRFFSDEELLAAGVEPALFTLPNYVKAGAPLDAIDQFDATFFGYTPFEARIMDPQHRLFLECSWEALEQAGYDPYSYRGLIGVFAGCGFGNYYVHNIYPRKDLVEAAGLLQIETTNDRDSLASIVSYKLNLKGPAVAVQTFCSTSLVAVHMACQSLLSYESDLALAGGVAIQIPHGQGYLYEEGGIFSPDGECRTFDARAQGSVLGNGGGVVVLKRLREALDDGDFIYAIIRGSTVNNDGSLRVSYTAPGVDGQASAILGALSYADVPAESISYIETHGTGTRLGDAVEIAAMRKAFEAQTDARQFCALGSVKPNVGHLDRASGVTGLIKTILALHHRQLPPSINFEQGNPEHDLANSPFYVNTSLRPWPASNGPRRAGVSSFGLGGTNAHVILEEAPTPTVGQPQRMTPTAIRPWQLLLLSAKTETALQRMEENLAAYLHAHPDLPLTNVAYTLQVGRSLFRHRSMLICRNAAEAVTTLRGEAADNPLHANSERRDCAVGLVFFDNTIFLSQLMRQAQELYAQEPIFKEAIDQCNALLLPGLGINLQAHLLAADTEPSLPQFLIRPMQFAIEYAVATVLLRWGLRPQMLAGGGIGACVAACVAGIFSLKDALKLIECQACFLKEYPKGAQSELQNHLSRTAASVTLHPPQIPALFDASGTPISREQAADLAYWIHGLVQSEQDVENGALQQATETLILKIGAGQALCTLFPPPDTQALPALSTSIGELPTLLKTLGTLWLAGVSIDWESFHANEAHQRVPLPTYPFERQGYWIESPEVERVQKLAAQLHSTKRSDIADWFYIPTWERMPLSPEPVHNQTSLPQSWLIFSDERGPGQQIAQKLQTLGHSVVQVRAGSLFAYQGNNTYTLRPAEKADYITLCHELTATGYMPQRILHCWSLLDGLASKTSRSSFKTAQEYGFYSMLHLVQALGMHHSKESIQLNILTWGMQKVTDHDLVRSEYATLLGACKVIPQEYLTVTCRSIDLQGADSNRNFHPSQIDLLLNELTGASSNDFVVAYRDEARWVQHYRPRRLEACKTIPGRLRLRGTYVITGGLGNVGLTLARYLAQTMQARLVLIGRTALPARNEWSSWLENHPHHNATSQKLRQMIELEHSGAEVLALQADVVDAEQMEKAFEEAERLFGPIHGIIHAAGITNEKSFKNAQQTNYTDCEMHFHAKVYGLLTLEQVLRTRTPDFCLVCSSLAAILGGLGLFAYAAANAFMDAFIQQQRQQSKIAWLSINWDSWSMQERPESIGATVASYGMTLQESCESFARIMDTRGDCHLINSTGDLAARIRQWVHLDALHEETGGTSSLPLPSSVIPATGLQRSDYERLLSTIWQEVLGLSQIGLYDNFFDLGGNSLNGLQVVARMRKLLQIQLPVVALFEAPTISAMVDHLLSTVLQVSRDTTSEHTNTLKQRRQQARERTGGHDIAIVAMTGRFPGASTIEQFWQNLQAGVESITFFDEEELLAAGVDEQSLRDPNYVKARPILPQELIESFDAAFFGYSPREAELLDPQHRLFLECCWEALERAGYAPNRYDGRIGVFGGANISTYLHAILQRSDIVGALKDIISGYQIAISMDKDSLTTAVSYKLNLKGPSLAVQTFCSTALVAVHLACQSLLTGESDMALAGGVSISIPTKKGYIYDPGGMESPDGHCRTFDAQAKGSLFGDGVGVVVLKRLTDALEDGDQVLAIIKGSAINNDGSLKVSYTAPSVAGQAEVVQDALANAGVTAESISYVEAHGTATELGDPIELASLTKAYRSQTEQTGYCAIGSVKTNIGHLDRAAGASGLIKTVLALQHEQLPPSLHYQSPNPEIDFEHSPFYVNTRLRPWPRTEQPRRAGVNSLGMGGTNAHVILEEAPAREASSISRPYQLLLLSARTETALQIMSRELAAYLPAHPELPLADVAYTLQVGRTHFPYRRTLVCYDTASAVAALRHEEQAGIYTSRQEMRDRPVAFLFPQEGESFTRAVLELYTQESVIKRWIDHCCELLLPYSGCDLREVLFTVELPADTAPANAAADLLTLLQDQSYRAAAISAASERLKQTKLMQPSLFVMEYVLAQLLMHWGIRPQAMLGYDVGEYVAACLAGVFSLEDALMLVARRAQLIEKQLSSDIVGEELDGLMQNIKLHPPQIPCLSHRTGTWITDEQATDPTFWTSYMSQAEASSESVKHLLEQEELLLLEVGPGQSLASLVERHPDCKQERLPLVYLLFTSHNDGIEAIADLLTALGKLWLAGVKIDWQGFYANERRHRVLLPTYPFERQRYWLLEPGQSTRRDAAQLPAAMIKRKGEIADWFYRPSWQQQPLEPTTPATTRAPWLVFADETGFASRLIARLHELGHLVISVLPGERFAQLDTHTFTLPPHEQDAYRLLCETLATQGPLPRLVLHAWSLSRELLPCNADTFQQVQPRGFSSVLALSRALSAHSYDEPISLFVLSSCAQQVLLADVVQPEHAPLLGACLIIPQEPLNLACCSIDLDLPLEGTWSASLVEQVLSECLHPQTDVVAYRAGERWVPQYLPVALPALPAASTPFRMHGVYLITGGLGGIGLTLAEYLAQTVQARLVLLSRSSLPSRHLWQDWLLSHPLDDSTSQIIQRLHLLEGQGAQIVLYQADVADAEQLRRIIAETRETFGALHGVFHAAGITDARVFKSVQEIRWQECAVHFQAKVEGTYALASALQGVDLDFCLLFSSLSAVLGGLGFLGYTAANSFLDAFAHRYNQQAGTPWQSVNWDTWQVKANAHGELGATIAAFAMQPQEAIEAMTRVLLSRHSHLINSTGDLHARLQQWRRTDLLLASGQSEHAVGALVNRGDYEQIITSIWQEVLGMSEIGLYDNFFDLGGNSLTGIQLIRRLKKALRRPIPAVALFEAPTISALTRYLQPEAEVVQVRDVLAEQRSRARQQTASSEIALIGMSGRFPGAPTIEQFWHNLQAGVESIRFFTPEELEAAGVPAELIAAPNYVPARPVLDDDVVQGFDAAFFGYSPREAELTDPQHRLFLECAWEALEQAGYAPQSYPGLIGIFGGTNISTYALSADRTYLQGVNEHLLLASNDKDSLTSTVSYKLNLRGPSFAVQTFCSTSLVAVHLACQSLLHGECDLALAGGVSVRVPSNVGHLYEPGGMESPDGHCRTFDAQAKGSLFGDGVGLVTLKRLTDAIDDGDLILAVIKGSAINNDGSLKVSYAAPSVAGQAQVVQAALERAGVSAESISYVEAHGTATELGDPIELASLTKAYRSHTEQVGYCAIGSVKTNVGHLDRAAGASGLIKTVLALLHEQLPASLHYQSPNPEIDFAHSPFSVNTQLRPWRRGTQPRRAGINSLGMGGTNAHVIVEEAPIRPPSGPSRPWQVLPLSARSPRALEQVQQRLAQTLSQQPELPLADVAYTLQVGRQRFEQRSFLVCQSTTQAVEQLMEPLSPYAEQRTDRPVAFLLAGVGEQYAGMSYELYQQETAFREAMERCCSILQPLLGLDLREILFAEPVEPAGGGNGTNGYHDPVQTSLHHPDLRALLGRNEHHGKVEREAVALARTELAQPLLFVVEYALAQLLIQWGIRPQAMLGYSLGEYVAACLSGVLSLEDALTLVARRAQLIQQLPGGEMIAVSLSEREARLYLNKEVSLSAINGPTTCVLAGPLEVLKKVTEQFTRQGIAFRYVETTHAFHSHMLDPLREQVTELARDLTLRPPSIPYISNVTGTWITAEQATDPAYWAEHMCQAVRFADGIGQLLQLPESVLLELGPGPSLCSFVKQHPACQNERKALVLPTLPAVHERQSEQAFLLTTLGKLWLTGVAIDWHGYYAGERRQRVSLPTYPFERQRYWMPSAKTPSSASIIAAVEQEETKRENLEDWFYLPSWKRSACTTIDPVDQNAACWLIFVDSDGLGGEIAGRLAQFGHSVVRVESGTRFSRTDHFTYTVSPTSCDDYVALLKELRGRGLTPQRIVHLWTAGPLSSPSSETDESLNPCLEQGFYSLITLAQALGNLGMDSCQVTVISSDMQDVTGSEPLCPIKSTVLGPCKVIPQEYPQIRCRSIDISFIPPERWAQTGLIQQLLGELLADISDTVIALRGPHRWVQTFEPIKLANQTSEGNVFRHRGVYLITGGLGGIGLALAAHLATKVQARLVLTGRTQFPPRHEWPAILASSEEASSIAQKIRQIHELEQRGAEVLIAQADVSDEEQMQAVIRQTLATFGELHGVFHAAGTPASGLMQIKTPTEAEKVLAPKVKGTLTVARVCRQIPLDFLILFSSICSATGGGPGQVDYCAANAFLDAYAHQQMLASSGCRTIVINWGEWQWNAWDEGLSGFPSEAQQYFRERRQKFGIGFEEGIEALECILQHRLPQVVVSTEDFQRVLAGSLHYSIATILQAIDDFRQSRSTMSYTRPLLGTAYVAPESELEQKIATMWGALLGIEQIGIHDNFFELGGHSLIGTQLIARLRQTFQVDIRLATLFAAPTVAELAVAIEIMLIEEIEQAQQGESYVHQR